MRVLATFAGKFGDILWMLPSLRALSRRTRTPIDLLVAKEFGSICSLVERQPYINRCWADEAWKTEDTAPISPRVPPGTPGHFGRPDGVDLILDLSYRGWPQRPLPFETLDCLNEECSRIPWKPTPTYAGLRWQNIPDSDLSLDEPWITVPRLSPTAFRLPVSVGFTDEYFELKYGLYSLLCPAVYSLVAGASPRWTGEGGYAPMSWEDSTRYIAGSQVFLGCCSALHVLAVATGTPVVLMEPQEARWQDIFYPLGKVGPQVTLVTGTDGRPTFDSRHVREALEQTLSRQKATLP